MGKAFCSLLAFAALPLLGSLYEQPPRDLLVDDRSTTGRQTDRRVPLRETDGLAKDRANREKPTRGGFWEGSEGRHHRHHHHGVPSTMEMTLSTFEDLQRYYYTRAYKVPRTASLKPSAERERERESGCSDRGLYYLVGTEASPPNAQQLCRSVRTESSGRDRKLRCCDPSGVAERVSTPQNRQQTGAFGVPTRE